MLVWAMIVATAQAVDVHIDKQSGASVYLFVDGKPQGMQRGPAVTDLTLAYGEHEVWLSYDPDGRYVYCSGLLGVKSEPVTLAIRDRTCGGLKAGIGKLGTMSLGATVQVWAPEARTLSVAIDGGNAYEIGAKGALLDLSPGEHAVWVQDAHGVPVCQGVVTAERGATGRIVASSLGCSGMDDVIARPTSPVPATTTSADAGG